MGEYTVGLPPGPWAAKGNRVYSSDGEEIAVATNASSRWRGRSDWTAQAIAGLPDVVRACMVVLMDRRIRVFLRENDPKAMEQMVRALNVLDPIAIGQMFKADDAPQAP